jgi:transposase
LADDRRRPVAFALTPGNIAGITMAIPLIARKAYRRRNVIERLFRKLKNWRRIATRYDRLAQNYLSGLALAAIFSAWI